VVDDGAPIDDLIEGLSRAVIEGRWQPDDDADARRRALLPLGAAPTWDALVRSPRYQHALELLP
jgi:beta-N-acetylhexosaminidase